MSRWPATRPCQTVVVESPVQTDVSVHWSLDVFFIFYASAACIGKGGSMQSDGSVCDSVGDLVSDNPRSSGMAEASDFILCLHIES